MNLEELKGVDLTSLEDVQSHITNTLSLEKEELSEYLKYALDTYYKSEDEGDNEEKIITFFSEEKFKPIYEDLMNTAETEDNA